MIYLINLEEEGRKEAYKLFSLTEFRKFTKKEANPYFYKAFSQPISRINKKEITEYVEEHYLNPNDHIVFIFETHIEQMMYAKFKSFGKLLDLVKDLQYRDLNEETIEEINSYHEEYEALNLPLSFENLIQSICEVDQLIVAKQMNEKQVEIIEKLKEDFKKVEKEHEGIISELKETTKQAQTLKKENDKQSKELKTIKNENEQLKEENKKLVEEKENAINTLNKLQEETNRMKEETAEIKQKHHEEKAYTIPLSTIIGQSLDGLDEQQVYAILDQKESDAINNDDYKLLKLVLAAKYTLARLRGDE